MATALVPIAKQFEIARPWQRPALVASFLAGRNRRTLEAYRRDLENFCRFLGVEGIDAAAQTLLAFPRGEANAVALAYRTHLVERGLQAATINRRLAALRSLVKLANT